MNLVYNLKKGLIKMLTGLDGNNVISAVEFEELMKNEPNLMILDVRNPDELVGPLGQIKGVVNIPLHELSGRLEEVDKYRNKLIAVICQSGSRSMMATKMLVSQGFNAINIMGGMIQYRAISRN